MTVKSVSAGPFALLALLLPIATTAQTISTSPAAAPLAPLTAVPVDNPLALAALFLVLVFAGWWSLRRSRGAQRVVSLVLVGALAGLAGHSSGLMAQALNAFTNSSGETLSIGVVPITAGGFTGFQPADFSNASGVALRIEAIDPPDLAECFATNPANTLLPPGVPVPSPHPACTVGATLATSAVCRVDVEAICRALVPEPAATLTAISPNSGSTAGGAMVTLTGTGLTAASGVTFGGIAAASVVVINPTTITAITPAHPAGVVDVAVTTPSGSALAPQSYTYMLPPTVAQVSPNSGSTTGGTSVTLTGSGLSAATGVTFDGISATSVNLVDSTTITAITPAHAAGTVDVTVTTPSGVAPAPQSYTYMLPPTVAQVSPSSGSTAGGTSVVLTGTGLTAATGVTFGGIPASTFIVNSSTSITAIAPAHVAALVDVAVTTPSGSALAPQSYTYMLPPTVTQVSPSSGSTSGGVGVILTGSGLLGTTSVTFDGVPATNVNVLNSSTITAVTPAHAAGAVDIVVMTPSGAALLSNGYIYLATAVGQSSGGGKIAALGGGSNNLIAATTDNSPGIAWGELFIAGPGAQSLTDGASNTVAIEAFYGNNNGVPYAAKLCSSYEVDSQGNTPCQPGNACYNDWFLPASSQLALLFTNRTDVGGFTGDAYWSSTESQFTPLALAGSLSFTSGSESSSNKTLAMRTRCVRTFTP
ncbi:midcut-by-XrtH protein [Ottowia thiooxydans]|uniref:midcut-by-XrtH protein n=1 Tax=Ottowia thiooxydans TaxID=219182 RepID=UPI0004012854|nr:midcut-by-XrtH protein [Ottowia thiooxydans]